MPGASLRKFVKWGKSPIFTARCHVLLVRILLYTVLELGTGNKLNSFTLCMTKYMKDHQKKKNYQKTDRFFKLAFPVLVRWNQAW